MAGLHFLTSFTKYLLCVVSLALTALFALSFTSTTSAESNIAYLPQILMVSIGGGIDLSKYLFWRYRAKHLAFYCMASVLVLFSCMASIAFFVTQEHQQIERGVVQTSEYKAYTTSIELLEKEIQAKQKLLDARLASQYHQQWDKAEDLVSELAALRDKLNQLINENHHVGVESAQKNISTAAFFLGISELLGVPFQSAVTLGYALLALLIELSALGVIAMSEPGSRSGDQVDRRRNDFDDELEPFTGGERIQPRPSDDTDQDSESPPSSEEAIIHDILTGESKPILRQLIKQYGIQYQQARDILDHLLDRRLIRDVGLTYEVVPSLKKRWLMTKECQDH